MNIGLGGPCTVVSTCILIRSALFALTTNVFAMSAPGKTSDRAGMNTRGAMDASKCIEHMSVPAKQPLFLCIRYAYSRLRVSMQGRVNRYNMTLKHQQTELLQMAR